MLFRSLLQNAAALSGKATTDALPGYKTPKSLAAIGKAIGDYQSATATQAERELDAENDRIARDNLVCKINARRMAIQHAADALWPYTDSDNAPTIGSWGGPFPQGSLMCMGDSTVRMFPYSVQNLGAFLTPDGGEVVVTGDN